MKFCMFTKALLLATAVMATPLMARTQPNLAVPAPAVSIAAKSYLLTDLNSGEILASQNPHERLPMASLTKLMTTYVTFAALHAGKIRLDQIVPVSTRAWKMGGSRMFLDPRKPVTVDQLIHGMLIDSGNDACIALAEAIAGSEEQFVALMNQTAQKLGMKDTHYMDVTGLPHPDHYTTAADLTLLARALLHDFPEVTDYDSVKQYTYNGITQKNRNELLFSDPRVDGMKTGFTNAAGYCQVTSARQGNMHLIGVVLGTQSKAARASESEKLISYGFDFFETRQAYTPARSLATLQIAHGTSQYVAVGVPAPAYVTVPHGAYSRLVAQVVPDSGIKAPVRAGQPLGQVRLLINDKAVARYPLVARQAVPEGGWLARVWDGAKSVW